MKHPPVLSFIFVFLFPFLIGLPSLSMPFTLGKDAKIIKISQDRLANILTIESDIGYTRPVFWLTSHIPFAISGANPASFHFFRLLIFSLSSSLIFLIIYSLTRNSAAAIITSLGYLLSTYPSETFHNLAAPEPLLVLFLLFAVYSLINLSSNPSRPALILTITSLSLAAFTQESAVAVTFPLILLTTLSLLVLKKITAFTQHLFVITLFQIIVSLILFFLKNITGATQVMLSNMTFEKTFILRNFDFYQKMIQKDTGYLFPLALIIFLIILIKKSKDLRNSTSMFKVFCLFFLALSASLLAFSLPGNLILPSNLSPILMSLFLFIGCSLSYYFTILRRLKKSILGRAKVVGHLLALILLVYILIFFYFQIKEVVKEISTAKERAVLHSEMVKTLAQNLPKDKKAYFIIKEDAPQFLPEMNLPVLRLNPNLLPDLNNGDLIVVSRGYQDIPDSLINQILSRKTLLYSTYLWTIYRIER